MGRDVFGGPCSALLRRAADLLVAGILLLPASPILALTAILVRLTSGAPTLFSQERVGRGGARFRLYKIRTMRADAESLLDTDPVLGAMHLAGGHKIPDAEDPRITSLGRILRRMNLDELPQLYNILRGDMSLIGPRPIVPTETERYEGYLDLMCVMRPGITGPWQISGGAPADYASRERIDREYARNRSLRRDLAILFRTLRLVVRAILGELTTERTSQPETGAGRSSQMLPNRELGEREENLQCPERP